MLRVAGRGLVRATQGSRGSPRIRSYSSEDRDDLMYVNPADPGADTKDFFKFQTGRWLENDQAERDARTTKFSLSGLLDVLKAKVDYLQKTPEHSEIAIETIEPLFEGKHNKLYKASLKDGRIYTLRIPYAVGHAEYREKRLLSEVATMDFLQKKHGMKIPTPISWSATRHNELESPYILMDFVAGEKLMKYWKPWSSDLKEKSAIVKPVVDFNSQMLTTEFNKYGSLYFTEDVDPKYRDELPYENESDPELFNRWRIGPTTEKRFWKGSNAEVGAPYRGPWSSYEDYLNDTAALEVALVDDALKQDQTNAMLVKARQTALWYQETVPQLFYPNEYTPEVYSPRLNHPDLSPMNILAQSDLEKFWLLDFENTAIRPFMLHGLPWFVRNRGEKIYKKEEVPNYDSLPEEEKLIVDHYIRLTETEFTYEFLFHKAQPKLFPGLNPSIKRREELVERALGIDITTGFYNDLTFALYKLGEAWPFLNLQPQREYPVKFTQAELDVAAEDINSWSQKVSRNTIIESKGFLSATLFDQYLGEGKLVPKGDGNYEFTEEFLDTIGPKSP